MSWEQFLTLAWLATGLSGALIYMRGEGFFARAIMATFLVPFMFVIASERGEGLARAFTPAKGGWRRAAPRKGSR